MLKWAVLFAAIAAVASAADFNPRRALLDHLKEKSDCEVPPSPEALPIKVQVSIKLMRILDACPENYCVKLQLLEMYNWTDPRLKWNPENYGGIDYLPIDIDHIWLPDVDIAGEKNGESMRKRFQDDKATVLSSGSVLLIAPQKYKILCNATVWQESVNGGSSSSKSKKSSISLSSRRSSSDPRQRQLQLRKSSSSSGSGEGEKEYTCEFYQTSWTYDTDIVEVVPATPEEEEGRRPSGSHRMNIRTGGPSRRGGRQQSGEDENEDDNESEQDDSESSSSYPFNRQQQSRNSQQRSSPRTRRQNSSNGKNGKNGKTSKKIPFSQWTTTACTELFEPTEEYDLSSFTAYRELNTLPYAPDRQWSMVYYRIGIVDKKPEDHENDKKKPNSKSSKKQVSRQQQTDEEEEEEEERRSESEPSSYTTSSSNIAQQSKRDLKQRRSINGRKAKQQQQVQIDTSAQEDETSW